MRTFVALVLLAVPALGAEIAFEREPRLGEAFHVMVTGVPDTAGRAHLINLRTGEVLRVELWVHGGGLRSGPIHVRRPCDDPKPPHTVMANPGDVLVAATDLKGGLSATAKVGPRLRKDGEPKLTLERWDNDQMKWLPADRVIPALYRAVMEDTSQDTTCEPDRLDLSLMAGGKAFPLALGETTPTSGRFVGEFAVSVEPKACELWLRILTREGGLIGEVAAVGEFFLCERDGQAVQIPLGMFLVELSRPELGLPVGCCGEVRVVAPERPEEVRWCIDGVERPGGLALTLCAEALRSLSVVALVRKDMLWGRAETTVTYVARVKLTLLDAESGLPVVEPWPCGKPVRVKLENVPPGVGKLSVGRLGPDPRARELGLHDVGKGVYWSEPFRPSDFGACAGEVLWAQYRDPTGCYTTYATLSLR